jgi:SOS-response transcriptional repressor LexA
MLTPRQAELLAFVRSYMAAHAGAAPSHREIMLALGPRSKSRVSSLVDRLV